MQDKDSRPILPVLDVQPLVDAVRCKSEALATALSKLLEKQVQEQLDEMRCQIEQDLAQLADEAALQGRVFGEVYTSLGSAMQRTLSDARLASKDIAHPLKEAGFWVPPSAPMVLIARLRGLVRHGPPGADAVPETLVDFYDAHDASRLREMVSGWTGNPSLGRHQRIIQDAVEAHVAGKYTLSIPTLLPIVERLLTALHGAPARSGKLPGIATEHIQSSYSDFMREAGKDAVLHYITGTGLYGSVPAEYFTVDAFPGWLALQGLTERDVVNRHAILHGVQVDYAGKENSLRVFLLIDVLSWLTRKDWDNRLKTILKQR